MKIIKLLRSFELIIMILLLWGCGRTPSWTPLLDKNLSRWDTYLSYSFKNDYKGDVPVDENGLAMDPIGYNKNVNDVFTVIDSGGTLILKISGEIYGCVFTRQEFENYHLKLKVKWGAKKWEPRLQKFKDSGILYNSRGECGLDYWRSWMLGQEFQVMEGHMGDYWSISTSGIDIRAFKPEGNMNAIASYRQPFLSFGKDADFSGYCLRSADYESPADELTELELISFGDKSLHIVNGHVVMILKNSHYMKDGQPVPLIKGKIQIQSEAAEVFYKDIMIRNISALPEKYSFYYDSNN